MFGLTIHMGIMDFRMAQMVDTTTILLLLLVAELDYMYQAKDFIILDMATT